MWTFQHNSIHHRALTDVASDSRSDDAICMKILKIFGLILGVTALGLAGATAWLLTHEEELENAVLEAIAAGLQTDAHIDDLALTWWSSFPKVSVELQGVWLEGSGAKQEDKLLTANVLGLDLDLISFLKGSAQIDRIRLAHAQIILRETPDGWNTAVWQSDPGSTSAIRLDLRNLLLDDVRLRVLDRAGAPLTDLQIDDASSALSLSPEGTLAFTTSGDGLLLAIPEFSPSGGLPVTWEATGTRSQTGDLDITLSSGELAGTELQLACSIAGDLWNVNGSFSHLDKNFITALFPDLLQLSDGSTISFDHELSGALTAGPDLLKLTAHAPRDSWNRGLLTGSAEADLELARSTGKWSLTVSDGLVELPGTRLPFTLRSRNLAGGTFTFSTQPAIDLGSALALADLVPGGLSGITGSVSGNLEGTLTPEGLGSMSGTAEWSAVAGNWEDLPLRCAGGTMKIDQLNENWSATLNDLEALGTTTDWTVSWNRGRGFDLQGEAGKLALLTDFIDKFPEFESSDEQNEGLQIERLTLTAQSFAWPQLGDGTLATGVHLTLQPNSGGGYSFVLTGAIADGPTTIRGEISPQSARTWALTLNANAKSLALQPLFVTFRNFNQTTLRSEHIRGTADITGDLTCRWDLEAGPIAESLNATWDLTLKQVRLDNVEAFQEIADYLRENRLMAPLVDPDDLSHRLRSIDIAHCESPMSLVAGDLQIPPLTVESSAMDIDISGGQTWAGSLDYTLGFALRDLRNSREDAFGSIEDDGLGHRFFLTITGPYENPAYGWDREAGKNARRERFEAEKSTLRELFGRKN